MNQFTKIEEREGVVKGRAASGRGTMGAGGRMSAPPSAKKSEADIVQRAPHSKPQFTLSQLKKAIPPHCFQRSVLHSFSYVISDLTWASLLYYIATNYFHLLPHPLSYLAWPIYWAFQGCILTGVWVIAHECGHHAFSDYQWLDDTVGLILHSSLLVPYFSWKYSHRRHHSNTGSLEKDEVFVPKTKSKLGWRYSRFACHFDPHDYGILNKVFHHITDTHVAHHLFSTLPHYHAMEATKAIKPVLGDYYQFDGTPFYKAMWREAKECVYVQSDGDKSKGVFWYQNKF
ncbi:unnamed protein product, partial [Vitis vinifera]